MMGITEKTAYLKGLLKGLEIDQTTKEGKLLVAIVDVVDEIAASVADLEYVYDALEEDLTQIEEDLYDFDQDDDDDCGCDDACGCGDDCGCDDGCDCDDERDLYEIVCPSCKDTIYLNEEIVDEGSIDCPNCGENLEFDYSDDEK